MEREFFCLRLSKLRISRGISARDMSLSIGQSPSYINNIETGVSLPSMSAFFYICDFLGVTPSEFFDENLENPVKYNKLADAANGLSEEQLDALIFIAENMKKR